MEKLETAKEDSPITLVNNSDEFTTSQQGSKVETGKLEHTDTIEDLQLDGLDPIYRAKVHCLNQAMRHIGMGRYQWCLWFLTGFGWLADNMWEMSSAVILPVVILEFNPKNYSMIGMGLQIGLIIGASVWSLSSDSIGRRLAFNITLAIASIFGTAMAGAPNFIGLVALLGVAGIGIGGNLPIDSSIFIEFCPASHQWLLTVMSVWWCLGQILASLIGWPLVVNFSCPSTTKPGDCPRSENMGWRYTIIVLGLVTIILFILRTFVFKLYESPKFYLAHGQDEKALEVIFSLAKFNRVPAPDISLEKLQHIENETRERLSLQGIHEADQTVRLSRRKLIANNLRHLKGNHIKALFSNFKMAYSTTAIILIWGMIGIGYNLFNAFLPVYLETHGTNTSANNSLSVTYSHYAITSVCGIPGSIFGGWLVERKRIGRKGTLAGSTLMTALFLFCYTQVNSTTGVLGFSCAIAVTQNLMYGVLYAYTPEVFPAPHRGTGIGLASAFCRLCNTLVPIIATFVNLKSSAPMWVSGAMLLCAGLLAITLPYESNGKNAV